jgi:hypothetical protein
MTSLRTLALALCLAGVVALGAPSAGAQTSGGQGFTALAPIPKLTDSGTVSTIFGKAGGNFALFFNNLYLFCIGIAVILAIGMIIWGGFEYAVSEAVPTKSAGKQRIQQALFGLLLVLSPALVFYIINPAILRLDVNFPPLNTEAGTYVPPPPDVERGTENACSGSDCSDVAKKCTDAFADPPQYAVYQCVNADGTIASDPRPDTKPVVCKPDQKYYVACT